VGTDRKPDATVPIACTLDAGALGERLAAWRALLAQVRRREPLEGGVRLRFPAGAALAGEAERLAAAEQACCSFFAFELAVRPDGTVLDVRAPAEARELVDALFGAAT
jgi:hypothetical protein